MIPDFTRNYPGTDAAAENMINEGGAIRQPSMHEDRAAYSRLHSPCGCHGRSWREWLDNPTAMFWTGFAAGLALSILDNRTHARA